jgi:hypothetical protein
MTKAVRVVAICGVVSLLFLAADSLVPLNVKTGVWQITEIITWKGLPQQYEALLKNARPVTYKTCVRTKDLSTNPWAEGSREKCKWTALKSNGTDMDVRATSCSGDENLMINDVHGTIHVVDSENGTGTFAITMTSNGQKFDGNASYSGKWVRGTCPSNLN